MRGEREWGDRGGVDEKRETPRVFGQLARDKEFFEASERARFRVCADFFVYGKNN